MTVTFQALAIKVLRQTVSESVGSGENELGGTSVPALEWNLPLEQQLSFIGIITGRPPTHSTIIRINFF